MLVHKPISKQMTPMLIQKLTVQRMTWSQMLWTVGQKEGRGQTCKSFPSAINIVPQWLPQCFRLLYCEFMYQPRCHLFCCNPLTIFKQFTITVLYIFIFSKVSCTAKPYQ